MVEKIRENCQVQSIVHNQDQGHVKDTKTRLTNKKRALNLKDKTLSPFGKNQRMNGKRNPRVSNRRKILPKYSK